MNSLKTALNVSSVAGKPWKVAALLVLAMLSACAETAPVGIDAGCAAYREAALAMPDLDTVPEDAWGDWVTDTDDRMTATCRPEV